MILILAYLPTTIDNQLQHGQGDDDDRISNFISVHPFNDSSFAWQEGSLYFQCGSCHFQGKWLFIMRRLTGNVSTLMLCSSLDQKLSWRIIQHNATFCHHHTTDNAMHTYHIRASCYPASCVLYTMLCSARFSYFPSLQNQARTAISIPNVICCSLCHWYRCK